ncbi:MAG: (2Fe-2S) ferredoxin domain-containing protein [Prochloraceae cyanobacterium]
MSKLKKRVLEFNVVGQLIGFILKDGYKIKYLRVAISEQEYWIKLPKELRENLDPAITSGCWVQISGEQKLCLKTGKLKLKAYEVTPAETVGNCSKLESAVPQPLSAKCQKSKASILVCKKSSCWRRGGQAICQVLEESLRDRGLDEKVRIKPTGCLKQCKKGPNVVMMPDKARYSQVVPQQIPALLEKHFFSNAE